MLSGTVSTLLVLTTGAFIMGMLGNGFIGLVNCIDWVKNKKISSADCIFTLLAISRITFLWIVLVELFMILLWPHIYAIDKVTQFLTASWALANHLTNWFATCLSVFYFFKIAKFSHSCFAWLKRRINRVLLVLLLISLVLLLSNLVLTYRSNAVWIVVFAKHENNFTWSSDISKSFDSLIVLCVTYSIPFLLSLTSLLLLFLSLMRHVRNLQLNFMDTSDFNTEAHKKAMKMVMSFLLLFTVHSSCNITAHAIVFVLQNQEVNVVIIFLSTLFSAGHSFILVLGNSKLRQAASGLLRHHKCL